PPRQRAAPRLGGPRRHRAAHRPRDARPRPRLRRGQPQRARRGDGPRLRRRVRFRVRAAPDAPRPAGRGPHQAPASRARVLRPPLARLAEDLIWLSGPEFGFFALPESFTTGSSLMPQKKTPDALELVRGKAARVDGDLVRLLALMKGLPAGYQKDLQEDKEAVFDAADTAGASVVVMTGVVAGLGLNRDVMRRAAGREDLMAAGLAVALAREGMPFRQAHALVGSLVAEARQTGASRREV